MSDYVHFSYWALVIPVQCNPCLNSKPATCPRQDSHYRLLIWSVRKREREGEREIVGVKKGKDMVLYSAVSSPSDRAQSTLHFTPWQTCSFRHQVDFSWKDSVTLQSCATTIQSHDTSPLLSTARYSFIKLNEQELMLRVHINKAYSQ